MGSEGANSEFVRRSSEELDALLDGVQELLSRTTNNNLRIAEELELIQRSLVTICGMHWPLFQVRDRCTKRANRGIL